MAIATKIGDVPHALGVHWHSCPARFCLPRQMLHESFYFSMCIVTSKGVPFGHICLDTFIQKRFVSMMKTLFSGWPSRYFDLNKTTGSVRWSFAIMNGFCTPKRCIFARVYLHWCMSEWSIGCFILGEVLWCHSIERFLGWPDRCICWIEAVNTISNLNGTLLK